MPPPDTTEQPTRPNQSGGNVPRAPKPIIPTDYGIEAEPYPTKTRPSDPVIVDKTPAQQQGDTKLSVTGDATHLVLSALLGCAAFVGLVLTKRK